MITGEMKSKVDRLWTTFWNNGISNPLSVIEQISYLLFTEYEEVKYEHPKVILQKLRTLEEEIQADLDALEGLLG